MSAERRAFPRAKFKWPVVVNSSERSIEGVTLNVGPDGVFIGCKKPLKLNEVIENVRKVTTGQSPQAGQSVTLPPNTGTQPIDSSSGQGGEGAKGPSDMKDYKQNRQEYLNEAAKTAQSQM